MLKIIKPTTKAKIVPRTMPIDPKIARIELKNFFINSIIP